MHPLFPEPSVATPLLHLSLNDLRALRTDPLGFARAFVQHHGDRAQVRFVGRTILILSHPADIAEVLVTQARAFTKGRAAQRLTPLVGQSILTSEGATHHLHRTLARPAFHRQRLAQVLDIATRETLARSATWHDGEVRDLSLDMGQITLKTISLALFHDPLTTDADAIREGLEEAMMAMRVYSLFPWPQTALRIPLPASRRFHQAKAQLEGVLDRLLARRAAQPAEGDLLGDILAAQQQPEQDYSLRELRDDMLTFVLAGHETSANALSWALYLLATHPEIEANVLAEIRTVLGEEPVTMTTLDRLSYTRSVWLETLRLYPPVYTLGREARENCQIGDLTVAAQTNILMSPYVVHRDPRWYPDPDRFDPARWTPEARAQRPKLAFLPFGAGPRVCIGEGLAMMEGVVILATLLQHWQVERIAPAPVVPLPLVTLRPQGGMWLRLRRRA